MTKWLVAIAAALLASGCDSPPAETTVIPEFSEMPGSGNYAMIIPESADPTKFTGWAKEKCGDVPMCDVFGWGSRDAAARAMPLTDQEVASLSFHYKLNRNTGFERSLWNCVEYPGQKSTDSCL